MQFNFNMVRYVVERWGTGTIATRLHDQAYDRKSPKPVYVHLQAIAAGADIVF